MKRLALLFLLLPNSSFGCTDGKISSLPLSLLVFSPDGKWLVGAGGTVRERGGDEGIVKTWETKSWKIHETWAEGFDARVESVFFVSFDTVATVRPKVRRRGLLDSSPPFDGTLLRYWNVPEKKELEPLHLKKMTGGDGIAFHVPNKRVAFFGLSPRLAAVYTLPDLEQKVVLKDCPPAMLRFSPDGRRILAGIADHESTEIRLYDSTTGLVVANQKLEVPKDRNKYPRIRSAEFSPDGKKIAIGAIEPLKIHVFSADLSATMLTIEPGKFIVPDCVKFTPDSEMIAVRNKDSKVVELYSLKTKEVVKSFSNTPEGAYAWCFSPDGNWIAITSAGDPGGSGRFPQSKERVFEVKTGKLVAELD